MLIEKVLNNNTVTTTDSDNRELILMGKGIGFCRKRGDAVDEKKIEKRFTLENAQQVDQFSALLKTIPKKNMNVALEIIDTAQHKLNKKLSPGVYISLTDHINFAFQRAKEGLIFELPFENDVRMFYSEEMALGEYALDLIEQRLGIRLPQPEATSIALHIVNAEYNVTMSITMKITELISASTAIIQEILGISLDPGSLDYTRFVTHLKFLCHRIFTDKLLRDDFDALQEVIIMKYEREYEVSCEIERYVQTHYDRSLNRAELIFLTIHIYRMVQAAAEKE